MLLSDESTAHWLRENFVLSWEQIRPTAKVNIDFGNGHKMERTLVGNTCFIVALPDGTIVDALPGVYTPNDFIGQAVWSLNLARKAMASKDPNQTVRDAHVLEADLALKPKTFSMMSKAAVEAPLMMSLGLTAELGGGPVRELDANGQEFVLRDAVPSRMEEFESEDIEWFVRAIGNRIEDISKRPATSRALESGRYFDSGEAGAMPTPEQIVAADSRANVRYLRPAIHVLLSTVVQAQDKDALGRTLFKDLLHIDIDDPYLGLREIRIPGTDGEE